MTKGATVPPLTITLAVLVPLLAVLAIILVTLAVCKIVKRRKRQQQEKVVMDALDGKIHGTLSEQTNFNNNYCGSSSGDTQGNPSAGSEGVDNSNYYSVDDIHIQM